jgi:hypothetical protein
VLLRDARLWHAGVTNTSGVVRVMVATAYAPKWYAADPLLLPSGSEGAWAGLSVPVLASFTDDAIDPLDPSWSGLAGRQMRRQGRFHHG